MLTISLRRVPRYVRPTANRECYYARVPDVKVKNSGPTGTLLRKQAIQNPGSEKTITRQPT